MVNRVARSLGRFSRWVGHRRPVVVRGAVLGLVLFLVTFVDPIRAGTARAQDRPNASRLSLSISLKAQQQRAEAEIESTLDVDVVGSRNPIPVSLAADEHADYFTVVVPVEIQLQTPAFEAPVTGTRMRAFAQAAYQWMPISERDFLREGKFVSLPPDPTAASEGLGGEIRVDLRHQWLLSVGLSFPIELWGGEIELRSSVDYLGQWLRVDARAIGVQSVTDRLFDLNDDESKAIHYFGPRIALETDAGRWGPARLAVFAEGSLYLSRVFGSQSVRGGDFEAGETMAFRYEPDALLFQIGVGTRIYWDPQ